MGPVPSIGSSHAAGVTPALAMVVINPVSVFLARQSQTTAAWKFACHKILIKL
jgi:hypothetical protein